MSLLLWVILGVIVLIVLWVIWVFNSLIALKNQTQEAWADIEVQLKRRSNLIPNLIEIVKGYAKHEKEVFENVTKARAQMLKAKTPQEAAKAEGELTGALKTLFAVAENYPQLRASENFQKLQDELTDTEDKIQAARRFYNASVRDFNIRIQSFPERLIAGMLGFKPFEYFEVETEAERKVPKIKF